MRRPWLGAASVAVLVALTGLFYRGLIFDGLVLGDYDAFVYFYPLRHYAAEQLKQGHFPLWNPYLFLGSPFFANIQTAVLYPANLVYLWLDTPHAYSASVVGHVLLAGVSMYLFSRRTLGLSRLPSLLAAITFMFSGFMSGQVGHVNQLNVAAWLPLLLVAFDEAVRRRSLGLGIGAGLVGALQFLAGHTQEWYFSTATLGLFALWRIVVPAGTASPADKGRPTLQRLRPLAYLALVGLVEAGLTAVQVIPTLELSRESIRGGGMAYREAVSFSLPPTTALYTLLPTYPAKLFSEYVGYVGVAPIVLAFLAVAAWAARPATSFMIFMAAFGLFMAFGGYNPLYPLVYEWVPGTDLFRVPARWLLVYTFGVAGLAGLGAQTALGLGERLRQPVRQRAAFPRMRALAGAAVATLLIALAVVAMGLFYRLASEKPSRETIEIWVALAAAASSLAAVSILWRRVRLPAMGLLVAIVAAELWVAGGEALFRHPIPGDAFRPERSSTSYLLEDAARRGTPGRLLSFATDHYEVKETPDYKKTYAWLDQEALVQFMIAIKLSETLAPNVPMVYGIETVDGYDGGILPLRRYAELKELLLPVPGIPADNPLRTNLTYVPPVRLLDLLNVRYVLGTRLQDTTVDGVYYDRGISMVVEPGETARLERMPDLRATSVGLISSTEGARELEDGFRAAVLGVVDASGARHQMPLRLGIETGETPERDRELKPPAHRKPRPVPAWEPGDTDVNYYVKIPLPARTQVREILVKNLLERAKVRIRAITLIDDVEATSEPLVLSDRMDRRLFFDMKLYTSRDPLPRAFVTYGSVVRSDDLAREVLRDPRLPLDQVVVLAPSPTARTIYRSSTGKLDPDEARVRSYSPEEVVVDVAARQDGYLVLLDSFYPGWTARVDGVEVPIERANYLFRAVYVQEGEHVVVFRYEPDSFRAGSTVSLGSLLLLSGVLLVAAVRTVSRRRRM